MPTSNNFAMGYLHARLRRPLRRFAAAFLIASFLFPNIVLAQLDFGAADITQFPELIQAQLPGGGQGIAGVGLGLYVPVNQCVIPVLCPAGAANVATGIATTQMNLKQIKDAIVTGILKTAINIIRNMVVRWIATGRFEGPVFSTSFSIDAARVAENASRIFLSELTGINFCAGFDIPSRLAFPFPLQFRLSCSLPSNLNRAGGTLELFLHPERYSDMDLFLATQPENLYPWVYTQALEAKAEAEAKALIAFAAEYAGGGGFLNIKNQVGQILTPASIVKGLALESIITSPQRQLDVANTVQQAIAAILETAVRTLVEKGLSGAFGPEGIREIEFEAPRRAPPPPTAPASTATIRAMRDRVNAFLALPGVSIEEQNALRAILADLNSREQELSRITTQTELTRISGEIELLNLRLDTTIAATTFCRTQNPAHPLCKPTASLRVASGSNTTPSGIPDGVASGVRSDIAISEQLLVVELTVSVSIDHPSPEQLTIDLRSPRGDTTRLKGASQTPLPRTFATTFTVRAPFAGSSSNGTWRLTVTDPNRDGREGRLNSWSITIAGRP